MKVVVAYRGIPNARGRATGDSVVRALRLLGHEAIPYGHYYQSAEWFCPRDEISRPDLLIYLECNDEDPQYYHLCEWGCPKVYWEFDTATHLEWSKQWASAFDHVFLANRQLLDHFPRARWLPYACDEVLFHPASEDVRGHAAMLGSPFGPRVDFCRAAGIKLITGVFGAEYAEAVRRLKVHVHHHASGGAGLIVARPWETLASGTCLVAQDDGELGRLFEHAKHLFLYRTPEECRDTVRWLLANDEMRRRVGNAGRDEVLAHHTYVHRVREILETVGCATT